MKPTYIDERRTASTGRFSFSSPAAVPFRLDLTAWALRRRRGNLIDRWDGNTYRRMLPINGDPLEVGVCQTDSGKQSAVRVTVSGAPRSARSQSAIKAFLVRTLGLGLDLSEFYRMVAQVQDISSELRPELLDTLGSSRRLNGWVGMLRSVPTYRVSSDRTRRQRC